MIDSKTPQEVAGMARGGKKLGTILQELLRFAQPGVSLLAIEELASKRISESGGTASFQSVDGYKWATCLCVNDVVVHGIPTNYIIKEQDVLTIDIGLYYEGFHTDTAWTKIVCGSQFIVDSDVKKFLRIGEETLWDAVKSAKIGNRIGDISHSIQKHIEGAGYGVVRSLVGHGVGKTLHEEPNIPGILHGTVEETALLLEGMTIAVEVIYAMGKGGVVYSNDDGWSIATRDRSLSAVFEHTIAITKSGPQILTLSK